MNLEEAKHHLNNYVLKRQAPGDFLRAMLENDLFGALRHADPSSKENLVAIAQYIWNEIPANIWGSRLRIQEYLHPVETPAS